MQTALRFIAAAALVFGFSAVHAADWHPEKPVEIISGVAAGGAPEGVEFEDFEEEYQAGEGGLGGEWARVERGGGGGAARPRAKKAGEGDEEDEEMPAASAGGGGGEGAGAPSGG